MSPAVILETVKPADTPAFKRRLREAFAQAGRELFPDFPEATRWELCTPYRARKYIHFYVNRCGFRITEYFSAQDEDGGMFKLEKEIVR